MRAVHALFPVYEPLVEVCTVLKKSQYSKKCVLTIGEHRDINVHCTSACNLHVFSVILSFVAC